MVLGAPALGQRRARRGTGRRRTRDDFADFVAAGAPPVPGRPPLDDLGRAEQGARTSSRCEPDGGKPLRGERRYAGPAPLRAHPRRRPTARCKRVVPAQPRHRRQHLHGRHGRAAALHPGAAAARRRAAADGPLRPQPVQRAQARPRRPAARPRLRRLLRPRPARQAPGPHVRQDAAAQDAAPEDLHLGVHRCRRTTATTSSTSTSSRRTAASWLTRGAAHHARTCKRIYTFGYLGLYDDPERPDGDQVERGLLTRDGSRKPGYFAFRSG